MERRREKKKKQKRRRQERHKSPKKKKGGLQSFRRRADEGSERRVSKVQAITVQVDDLGPLAETAQEDRKGERDARENSSEIELN